MKKFLKQAPVVVPTAPGHRLSIIQQFCKGCEICIAFCPKDVLALDAKTLKVIVANPDQCIGCRLCEWNCPDLAILVEPARRSKKVTQAASPTASEVE